eukprot:6462167-Amphidinium_carterae.1
MERESRGSGEVPEGSGEGAVGWTRPCTKAAAQGGSLPAGSRRGPSLREPERPDMPRELHPPP